MRILDRSLEKCIHFQLILSGHGNLSDLPVASKNDCVLQLCLFILTRECYRVALITNPLLQ